MNTHPQRADAIFAAALEILNPAEQRTYLDDACAGNPELRAEVESLLRAHAQAAEFMGSSAGVPGGPLRAMVEEASPAATEKAGERIGRYQLLEHIGAGGFGDVWLAEQEEPVRRHVALKIIKPGLETKEVVARFEAERQALALMDHPNIAKVLDGGAVGSAESPVSNLRPELSSGRPYFVMELVRGNRITQYCDQHQLPVPERLQLFRMVCQAVQHAHQKGIIHRDLKPSNILVTVNEGLPVPKVIDFGIAKAMEQRLTDKTLFTGFAQFLGTPAYMSPEQAELTSLDIDTRSDIYSLGVLLYELLTGRTPFDLEEQFKAGLDEVRRTIREEEPMRPSTRLQMLVAGDLTATAKGRCTEPRKLILALRGDLDWIVLKCLEKDRQRRYETASSLALDVQRYLDQEPVAARPPSTLYRCQKFVRKYRTAVAVGTGFILLLAAATAVSTGLALWANRERASAVAAQTSEASQRERARVNEIQARQSAAESQAVLEFFQEHVLAATRPEGQDGGLGRNASIRAAVDAAEPTVEASFANQPLVESSIRRVLGLTYHYLGEYPAAIHQYERALQVRLTNLGTNDLISLALENSLASAYADAGRLKEAVPLLEQILTTQKSQFGLDHAETLQTMNNLAESYHDAGRLHEALPLYEEALRRRQARFGPSHPDTLKSMSNLASAYQDLGRLADAVRLLEQVLAGRQTVLGPEHPDTLISMHNLAMAYRQDHCVAEALPLQEEAYQRSQAKLGLTHPATLKLMNGLALAYLADNRPAEGMPLLEEALELQRATLGPTHYDTLGFMQNLANAYRRHGRMPEAIPLLEEIHQAYAASLGADHADTIEALNNLAVAYYQTRDGAKAIPLLEEALRLSRAKLNTSDPIIATALNNLGLAYRAAGRLAEALPHLEEALRIRQAHFGPSHADTIYSAGRLAAAYSETNRYAEAAQVLSQSLDAQRNLPANRLTLAETLAKLGEALLRQAKYSEAEPFLREGLALLEQEQRGHSPVFIVESLLGEALSGQRKYAEAESYLTRAYEGLRQRDLASRGSGRSLLVREAGQRLVQLYEGWGDQAKAAQWKQSVERLGPRTLP